MSNIPMNNRSSPSWIVYPSKAYPYNKGESVYIKTKSRKEIGKRGIIITMDSDFEGRLPIQIHKDYSILQRPSRLIPIFKSDKNSVVLVTQTTSHYRALATSQIEPDDNVLEIGCSNGECSILISRIILRGNGTFTGIDISSTMIAQAHEKIQSELKANDNCNSRDRITCLVMDPFTDPKGVKQVIRDKHIDTILIDIGGNRDFESVVLMLDWIQKKNENVAPKVIILKSEAMIQRIWMECDAHINIDHEHPKRIKQSEMLSMDSKGLLSNGQAWFQSQVSTNEESKKLGPPSYTHPFKAPISRSPDDNMTPICRYHNYHKDGCKKGTEKCEFDHIHCHWCKGKGHIALDCSVLL